MPTVNITNLTPYKHKTNCLRGLQNVKLPIAPPFPPPLPNPTVQTRRTTSSLPSHNMEGLMEDSGKDDSEKGYDTASEVADNRDDVA